MLRLSKSQIQAFDRMAVEAFPQRLAEYLTEECSDYMPFFPTKQRVTIAWNIVARCTALGFAWETNVALLGDIMLSVAPSFYFDPDIAPVLSAAREDDLTMRLATIAPDAWDRAEATRTDIPAWLPPDLDRAPPGEAASAVLGVTLWDVAHRDHAMLLRASRNAMRSFALPETLGALCLSAGWVHFYGPDREDIDRHPWLADILAPHMPSTAREAALRARIMLDHARRV